MFLMPIHNLHQRRARGGLTIVVRHCDVVAKALVMNRVSAPSSGRLIPDEKWNSSFRVTKKDSARANTLTEPQRQAGKRLSAKFDSSARVCVWRSIALRRSSDGGRLSVPLRLSHRSDIPGIARIVPK